MIFEKPTPGEFFEVKTGNRKEEISKEDKIICENFSFKR